MSALTKEQINALPDLLNRSTRGRRVQFMPSYCSEAKGTPFSEWDTSHETSVIRPDGSRMRGYAQHKHSDDAALDGWAPSLAATVIEQQAEIERLRNAVDAALAWDRDRGFIMPCRVRDPLVAAYHAENTVITDCEEI